VIVRHPHEAKFTVIDNATLGDDRLSWKARGILAYLLSKPDGWEVMVRHLVNAAPDGRDAVLSGLRELEAIGYLVRGEQLRTADGTFDTADTEIHERPLGGWPSEEQKPSVPPRRINRQRVNRQRVNRERVTGAEQRPIGASTDIATTEGDSSRGKPRASSVRTVDEDFDITWATYPRKLNRKGALIKYKARRAEGITGKQLWDATKHYAATVAGKELELIMHGATFYGPNERWRDYLDGPLNEGLTAAGTKPKATGPDLFALRDQIIADDQRKGIS
jgi:hypothetical protein